MKPLFPLIPLLLLSTTLFAGSPVARVLATDYACADGTADAAEGIQKMIDENPNRTLYFPDGVYLLSRPIVTPADPAKSVHIVMDNFAILRAATSWEEGAMLRLGGKNPSKDISACGSNYGIEGGIIDGSGIADGISIESGRETRVQNVSLKNVRIGLHILRGANGGSSDADVTGVNIVGSGTPESVGLLVEGYDNTFTNMRIARVHTGVVLKVGGNSLRNIHPLYYMNTTDYSGSCGFRIENGHNFLHYCYSDQFATGFRLGESVRASLTDCYCYWYSGAVPSQTAIECDGQLNSVVSGFHAVFSPECPAATFIKAAPGGSGSIRDTVSNISE